MKTFAKKINFLLLPLFLILSNCSSGGPPSGPSRLPKAPAPSPTPNPVGCIGSSSPSPLLPPTEPNSGTGITFNPVGNAFPTSELIDLEFLSGQNGDAMVIAKDGTVFYMKNDFSILANTAHIDVEDSGEQGLLNVAADPNYATNCFVYLYFTPPGGGINRVVRGTVSLDLSTGAFSLGDLQTIIEFPKSDSPAPGPNHNGGSLLFQDSDNLLIGVGDGGGAATTDKTAQVSQRIDTRLGKILRIVPSRSPGSGGFSLPTGGNPFGAPALPEIYITGVRNPFTLVVGNGVLFIGDVGQDFYEELDLSKNGGENFGWPIVEGPDNGDLRFVDPIGGYNHTTDLAAFIAQDPLATDVGLEAIMANHFYSGPRYQGLLSNRLIYNEFYAGFVRGMLFDGTNNRLSDDPLGHMTGMTSLQQGPDGFLYAVSLGGSDHLLRMELAP